MDSTNENFIEWIRGEKTASITFSQERFKTRLEKLAKDRPEDCQILERNEDGSIFAHVPLSWIKIIPPRELTEEQKEEIRERFKNIRTPNLQDVKST